MRERLIELLRDAPLGQYPFGDQWSAGTIAKMADYLIHHGVTVQRWIPVTERLPEEKGACLVVYHPCYWDDVKWDKDCVGVDTFRGKTAWAQKKYQRVTHWMPFPEPPKEEE